MDVFKFKRFQVSQNQNVHRVGTDGVLLGAWANAGNAKHILDIGTGTGVIALMLAQRSESKIIGIEPDTEAFSFARENFMSSPFKNKVQAVHSTLQDFHSDIKFDLIVCNPPYFVNSLKPPTSNRQQQRHTDSLSQTELVECAFRLLSPSGKLSVVLPTVEGNHLMEYAVLNNLYVHRTCAVFSKIGKPQERWLLEFGQEPIAQEQTQLHIMDANGQWTEEYKLLTRDFYLNF